MRIAFDGSSLRPRRTGVGYYSEHLLHHLALEAPPDDEIVVISNRSIETVTPLPGRVRQVVTPSRVPRLVWLQTVVPILLGRIGADVAHFTNGMVPLWTPVPTVVTIHDMSLTLYPRYHPPRRVALNRPLVNAAARRASGIITVSESAKADIIRHYHLAPERVQAIHEAAAPSFRRVEDSRELDRVRQRYGLGRRIILSVGTIEPRKNLPALLDAFASRQRRGDLEHQLVCVGPYGWLSRGIAARVQRSHVAPSITFTGYVPFTDLPALYSLAEMFVFPSIYEGFGLPVVEAMACGAPVITGPTAALTEVTGAALAHVQRLDAEALGDAMVALARDPDRRARLSQLGLDRARAFSWERAARETLGIYRRAVRPSRVAIPADTLPAYGEASIEPIPMVGAHSSLRETQQPWAR